jgi:hypothetical protein
LRTVLEPDLGANGVALVNDALPIFLGEAANLEVERCCRLNPGQRKSRQRGGTRRNGGCGRHLIPSVADS